MASVAENIFPNKCCNMLISQKNVGEELLSAHRYVLFVEKERKRKRERERERETKREK